MTISQLGPSPTTSRPGRELDYGQQVGCGVHQLRCGKRRLPQFADVRPRVFVEGADRYGRWEDKPLAAGRRRPGPVRRAGLGTRPAPPAERLSIVPNRALLTSTTADRQESGAPLTKPELRR